MNAEEFQKYYTDRYLTEVDWYDKKSSKYKNIYYVFQITLITLSALTPVFALLKITVLTTITATIVAICASLLKFMKLEELWTNYRSICETLKKEKYYFDANIFDYNKENKYQVFVERVENLISKENTEWRSMKIHDTKRDEENNK